MKQYLDRIVCKAMKVRRILFPHGPSDLEAVGAAAFILRASWMLYPDWASLPIEVQGYLIPSSFTEYQWGGVLIVLGISQLIVGCHRGAFLRGTIATSGAIVQGMAAIGYYRADQFYRGVVPMIIVIVGVQMMIAYRAWNAIGEKRNGTLVDQRIKQSG